MPGDRSESLYLSDILEAIDRILAYTTGFWDVVRNDLPPLRPQMEALRRRA